MRVELVCTGLELERAIERGDRIGVAFLPEREATEHGLGGGLVRMLARGVLKYFARTGQVAKVDQRVG